MKLGFKSGDRNTDSFIASNELYTDLDKILIKLVGNNKTGYIEIRITPKEGFEYVRNIKFKWFICEFMYKRRKFYICYEKTLQYKLYNGFYFKITVKE